MRRETDASASKRASFSPGLSHNATSTHEFWRQRLSNGTSLERIAAESLTRTCSCPFTATCRAFDERPARSGIILRFQPFGRPAFINAGESRARVKSQPFLKAECGGQRGYCKRPNWSSGQHWFSRWPLWATAKPKAALPAGWPAPAAWGSPACRARERASPRSAPATFPCRAG